VAHGGAPVNPDSYTAIYDVHRLPGAMADLAVLLLWTRVEWRSVATCEHRQRPWHDSVWSCSGVTEPAL
jgi:hypothetical protein